jgi:hypothetical protein
MNIGGGILEPERTSWSLQPEALGKQEGIREVSSDKVDS